MAKETDPFYKQPIFWMLMSGPIIVIIAAFFTFGLAHSNAADLVTDDYYKDGKHINLHIERDVMAMKQNMQAQVNINPDGTSAQVLVRGDYDRRTPLNLLLSHPAKKEFDQIVALKWVNNGNEAGDTTEYVAQFSPLPQAVHWYVRLEDHDKKWKIETKWLPSQGNNMDLKPNETAVKVLAHESASSVAAQ